MDFVGSTFAAHFAPGVALVQLARARNATVLPEQIRLQHTQVRVAKQVDLVELALLGHGLFVCMRGDTFTSGEVNR